jgi:hypothetical protein
MDAMNGSNTRSIGKGYAFYIPVAIGIAAFCIVAYIVFSLIFWTYWTNIWSTVWWWLNFVPTVCVSCFVAFFALLLKSADDKKTNNRGVVLHQVCTRINRTILHDSDVRVKVGAYSAWLEIIYDVNKSKNKFADFKNLEGGAPQGQPMMNQGPPNSNQMMNRNAASPPRQQPGPQGPGSNQRPPGQMGPGPQQGNNPGSYPMNRGPNQGPPPNNMNMNQGPP